MGKVCLTCSSSNRLQAERLYVQGKSIAEISRTFGLPYDSVWTHMNEHLSRQLIQAARKKQVIEGTTIINEVEELIKRTKVILDRAEESEKYDIAVRAIAEARSGYELLLKIAVALHDARRDELEQQRLGQEYIDREAREEALEEAMKVLTKSECDMYFKLNMKMLKQDTSMIVVPDQDIKIKENSVLKRSKPPKMENYITKEEITPENVTNRCLNEDKIDSGNVKIIPSTRTDDPETRRRVRREILGY